jgi:hypothetical protein
VRRTLLLSWSTDSSIRTRNFHFSKQISQGNIEEVGMENSTLVSTPMTTSCKLNKDDDTPEIDQTMYRSIICNLLYLISSRLDIIQVVGLVGRFQANPKVTHILAVKIIFRYL